MELLAPEQGVEVVQEQPQVSLPRPVRDDHGHLVSGAAVGGPPLPAPPQPRPAQLRLQRLPARGGLGHLQPPQQPGRQGGAQDGLTAHGSAKAPKTELSHLKEIPLQMLPMGM